MELVQPLIDLLKQDSKDQKKERMRLQGVEVDDSDEEEEEEEPDGDIEFDEVTGLPIPPSSSTTTATKTKEGRAAMAMGCVNDLLRRAGVGQPERTSCCMRAGLVRGLYGPFTGRAEELDRVVWEGRCRGCGGGLWATIRHLLSQSECEGEEGGRGAVVRCGSCQGTAECLTRLCEGKPERGGDGEVREGEGGIRSIGVGFDTLLLPLMLFLSLTSWCMMVTL